MLMQTFLCLLVIASLWHCTFLTNAPAKVLCLPAQENQPIVAFIISIWLSLAQFLISFIMLKQSLLAEFVLCIVCLINCKKLLDKKIWLCTIIMYIMAQMSKAYDVSNMHESMNRVVVGPFLKHQIFEIHG